MKITITSTSTRVIVATFSHEEVAGLLARHIGKIREITVPADHISFEMRIVDNPESFDQSFMIRLVEDFTKQPRAA